MKQNYHVKFLTEKDVALAEKVCTACEDFYLVEQGKKADKEDALSIITDLPPGKTKFDKFVMAILNEKNEPIGLLDVIADYPHQGEWVIGLLLIIPKMRDHGMGGVLHQVVKDWALDGGAMSLRVDVLESNNAAIQFWEHLGYQKIAQETKIFWGKEHQFEHYRLKIA